MQPVIVLFKRGEKFIYPTTLECRTPAIFRCTGPAPELLTIIAHYDDTFPVRRCQGTQGMNCFAGRTPGDGVTQRLAGGIDPQHAALIFSSIIAVKVLIFQPRTLKMHIIKNGPLDTSLEYQAW